MEVNGVGSKVGLATIKMSGPQLFVIQFSFQSFYQLQGKRKTSCSISLKYRNLF